MKLKTYLPLVGLSLVILSFFVPALIENKLPVPSDTIVGLYHPYRDYYSKEYSNGIPFKNFLITDPVRQQYPWKYLAIATEKSSQLPLWNPYTLSGTPLLANFQTAPFYFLNLIFFITVFPIGWGAFIIMQPILAGVFLYLYLKNLRLSSLASFLGGFVFAFSGFSVAWLEWGNIGHTALWLPLILLSIDKILSSLQSIDKSKINNQKSIRQLADKIQKNHAWYLIFIFALTSACFAGHLQTFFYLFITSAFYLVIRWLQHGRPLRPIMFFAVCYLLFISITFIQWAPTYQFILESGRSIDQADWQKEGWFIPWQHLIQFIAPDFFGNPTTLNYFGVWNYGEFIGYIGLLPLIFAIFAIFFRRDKDTFFFGGILLISFLLALPTVIAQVPYKFDVPLLASAQPTRLLFLIDFSLAVLAALGFDYFIREKGKSNVVFPIVLILSIFLGIWGILILSPGILRISSENLAVSTRNMQLPTLLLFGGGMILVLFLLIKNDRIRFLLLIALLLLTVADISRFAAKFTPFTEKQYLYPSTPAIAFLQKNLGNYRYLSVDSRILPPNFSIMYRLQTVEGYDPLYLKRYGEFIAASERGKADISSHAFNRIITPRNYETKIIDFLGVKYVLAMSDIVSPKLKKVFQEGETRIYENTQVQPRAFFVEKVEYVRKGDRQRVISRLFENDFSFMQQAIVELEPDRYNPTVFRRGEAAIISYSPNTVKIKTKNSGQGFLVLSDNYYPTWQASLVGNNEKHPLPLYRVNYTFRGVIVPSGEHIVEFSNTLL